MKRSATLLALLCACALPSLAQESVSSAVPPATPTASITSVNTVVCGGDYLKVYYSVSQPFNPGNQFTVELSDANGSFAAPMALRTFSSSGNGVVSAPVPEQGSGMQYRIRLLSTNPIGVSADNGSDIQINPMPTADPMSNRVLCPAPHGPIAFSGNGDTYTWKNDNTSIGLAASGTGTSLPAFNATNNGTSTSLAHITVRALSTAGCPGRAMGFRILVYPRATVAFMPPFFGCRGVLVPATPITGPVPGSSFAWSGPNALQVGLPATSGVGGFPAFTTINNRPPGQAATAEITITSTGPGGCAGGGGAYSIIVFDCINQPVVVGDGNTLRAALAIGPNPARSSVSLQYKGSNARLTVEIRDSWGRPVVAARTFTGSSISLNTEKLFTGTYYAVVSDAASGAQVSLAFVKL